MTLAVAKCFGGSGPGYQPHRGTLESAAARIRIGTSGPRDRAPVPSLWAGCRPRVPRPPPTDARVNGIGYRRDPRTRQTPAIAAGPPTPGSRADLGHDPGDKPVVATALGQHSQPRFPGADQDCARASRLCRGVGGLRRTALSLGSPFRNLVAKSRSNLQRQRNRQLEAKGKPTRLAEADRTRFDDAGSLKGPEGSTTLPEPISA